MGTAANPSVADLVDGEYLGAGTELTLWHKNSTYSATVTSAGELLYEGVPYGNPSAAAKAATGVIAIDGWAAWREGENSPLRDLRWRFRADRLPDDGHRFSDSYAGEMRMIASWWVAHTLDRGLDSASHDEAEVESFLGGNGYSESTLNSYRRHLRNWFTLYGSPDGKRDESTASGTINDASQADES